MTSTDREPNSQEHHADVGAAPPVTPARTGRMITIGLGLAVAFAALFLVAYLPRRALAKELAGEAAPDTLPPTVQVAGVHRATAGSVVELPGTIQALHEGAIYARVAGYVKRWKFDIGSLVRAGDVLAEIDVPELAQQVEQARQQLAQARAALGLARADLGRWKLLAADSAVSQAEFDQKEAAHEAATANVGAAEANLQRLVEMEKYTHVRAPFAGVVTARNIDIGSLITAAGATSAPVAGGDVPGAPGPGSLFRIAQTDTVRAYIPVPEAYATAIRAGLTAQVDVPELRGHTFVGRIVRTSHALDAASRTLLTEVDIANPGFVLLPGMYAKVRLQLPVKTPPLVIPSTALVIRGQGTEVMVVEGVGGGNAGTIHLRAVQVGRDFGPSMEILEGLADSALVVTNPTTELLDGMRVRVTAASNQDNPAPGGPTTAAPKPPH